MEVKKVAWRMSGHIYSTNQQIEIIACSAEALKHVWFLSFTANRLIPVPKTLKLEYASMTAAWLQYSGLKEIEWKWNMLATEHSIMPGRTQ
jgi:hypothetical protein